MVNFQFNCEIVNKKILPRKSCKPKECLRHGDCPVSITIARYVIYMSELARVSVDNLICSIRLSHCSRCASLVCMHLYVCTFNRDFYEEYLF